MPNISTIVNNKVSDSGVDITAKQNALSGSGLVSMSSGVASYITGTSSQFVKADGSIDSTSYLSSLTGEATNSGSAVTLTNSAVIGKVLTGLNVSSGAVISTDSIITALGKVQGQINSLQGGTIYKGSWNANTNTPTITSSTGTSGHYYVVTTAGTTNIDGISSWAVGDWIIFNGTVWEKIPNVDAVISVNGQTGAVSLSTSNISEGSNLYYTDARARAAITLTATGSSGASTYSSGVLNIPTYTLAGLGGVPTSRSLTINGTALDLSADRSFSVGTVTSIGLAVPTGFTASSAITTSGNITLGFTAGYSLPTTASQTNWDAAYNDKINSAAVTGTTTKTLTLTQQDGGTITASWTDINTDAVTSVFGRTGAVVATSGDYTTAQVTESGNLYYTDTRARTAVSFTAGSGAYNSSTGVFTIPTNTSQLTNGAGFITGNQTITLSGDVTGSGATSITTTLATITQSTGSSFVKITLDSNGRVTGNTNVASGDITTALGYTPYNSTNPAGYTTNTGTVTSITAGTYLTGGTITSSGTIAVDATTTNTASKIVARDASGNFSAGTITATLSGTASNATTLGTLSLQSAGSAPGANQVLRTDGNGYSYFGYINSNTSNAENPAISQIIVTNGSDGFYRKASLSHLTSAVQGAASGSWGISVTGSASTTPLVSIDSAVVYGRSGLQFAQSAGPSGNDPSIHQTPTGDWWHVLRMNHANNAGYYADLAVSMTTNLGLARRVISNGSQLSNWVTILDSLNYNSYSPTLTGTGASGTWGISISGNAATATNVGYSGLTGTVPTWNQNTTGNAATATTSSQVTINYSNNSGGTHQMLWGSGNSVYGTGNITCIPGSGIISLTGNLNSGGIGIVGFGRMYGGDFWHSGTNNNGTRTPTLRLGRFSDVETPAYTIYTDDTSGDILDFFSERYTTDFRLTRNSDTGLRSAVRMASDNGGSFIDLYSGGGSAVNSRITTAGDSYLMGGNVGIGISSPLYKLDVAGNLRFTGKLLMTDTETSVTEGSQTARFSKTYSSASGISNLNLYSTASVVVFDLTNGAYSGNESYNATALLAQAVIIGNSGTVSSQPMRAIMTGVVGQNGSATMNIADYRHFEVKQPDRAGLTGHVIQNIYGLKVADMKSSTGYTITNSWAIYQEGANDNNYFNGKVVLGSATVGVSKLRLVGLPTSATGLSSGDVWNNAGTLRIV